MMENMNEQDVADMKEIRQLEKIAAIRGKQGIQEGDQHCEFIKESNQVVKKYMKYTHDKQGIPYADKDAEFHDLFMEVDDSGNSNIEPVLTQNEYLRVSQIPSTTSLQVDLILPEYTLGASQILNTQKFTIIMELQTIQRIHDAFQDYTDIIAYTDGSSISNPGRSGSAVAVLGRRKYRDIGKEMQQKISGKKEYEQNIEPSQVQEREFFFGLALSLGQASNNYAEYVGIILAQLIFSMFKQTQINIRTDSMLIVNQVKGLAKTKNFRLVELIKIVHSLAFKFQQVGLDYIGREENTIADALAREASSNMVSLSQQQFKFSFKLESIMRNVQIKHA